MQHDTAHATLTFIIAAGMGIVTGMRSLAGPALISRHLSRVDGAKKGSTALTKFLRDPAASRTLTGLAAGEMVADKLPITPNRTDPPSIAGRVVIGGLAGAAVAEYRGNSRLSSALVGAAAAFGSTHATFHLRRTLRENSPLPDLILGFLEDILVLRSGQHLVDMLDE